MEPELVNKQAKELGISPVEIVREEMEVFIVDALSQRRNSLETGLRLAQIFPGS